MAKYRVKNFKSKKSETIQILRKQWIESRDHISIVDIDTWKDGDMAYSTIIYVENSYNL